MEIPKNKPYKVYDYYKLMVSDYKAKIAEAEETIEKNKENIKSIHDSVINHKNDIESLYDIRLDNYKDFVEDKVVDGKFVTKCKAIYRDSVDGNNTAYAVVLLRYAQYISTVQELEGKIEFWKRVLKTSKQEYKDLMKKFYYEAQRQVLVEGRAYKFSGHVGAVCINRIKNSNKKVLDSVASKARKAELIKQGIEIYNDDKARYYASKGKEYTAASYKVFKSEDYLYEFAFIWSSIKHGHHIKFDPFTHYAPSQRGKTYEDFVFEADGDINYIASLPIDFKAKLKICLMIDETLYLKYIRNEHQTSINATKNLRENGQRLQLRPK